MRWEASANARTGRARRTARNALMPAAATSEAAMASPREINTASENAWSTWRSTVSDSGPTARRRWEWKMPGAIANATIARVAAPATMTSA